MLPSSDLKPVKSDFAAKFDVSTRVGPFLSAFVAWLDRSNSTFIFTSEWSGGLRKIYSFKVTYVCSMSFFVNPDIKLVIMAFPQDIWLINFLKLIFQL